MYFLEPSTLLADRLGFYDRYALLGTILYIGILIGEVPINRLIQVSYSETSERGSRSDASLSFFFSSRVFLVAFPDSTYIQASQWARYMLGYSRALPRRLSQLVRLDGSSVPPRSLREWSSAYPGESSTFRFESVLSALSGGLGSIRHSSKSSEISKSTSDREERPWLTGGVLPSFFPFPLPSDDSYGHVLQERRASQDHLVLVRNAGCSSE